MKKSELYPKTFKDMNHEFQYLWNKYGRDDWQAENLGEYCANLEYMIMNYLDRNNELNSYATGIIEDVEIPEEVLKKIEEEKDKKPKPKKKPEEIIQDETIKGIPFANRIDVGPSFDQLLTYPTGELFSNDVMRNSYVGVLSLQGNLINNILKTAEIYYNLSINGHNEIY